MKFPLPEEIAAAVGRLKAGQLVAFPTETVYGLGADALSLAAVDAVYSLKGRGANNPLIVHVADVEMARGVVANWTREAQLLADAFWPGPLTIVLPKAVNVPGRVTGGGPNIAVRCPDHPVTLALLVAFGGPLVGPSANPSGRVSPTAAAHVVSYFASQQVMVLDGGACRAGIESTVVTLAEVSPRVLRLGVVSVSDVERVLGAKVQTGADAFHAGETGPLAGPGMLASHYAPITRALLADSTQIAAALGKPNHPVVVLAQAEVAHAKPHEVIVMPKDGAGYAANLYAALMRADACGAEHILIERPDTSDSDPIWNAVMDRLSRATAKQE